MPALLRPQGRGSRPRSAVVPNRAAALRSCTQAWRTSTSRPRRGDFPPGRCRSRASGGRRYARNRARRYSARTLRTPARPRSNPTPTRKPADVGVLDAADASDAGAAGRAGGRVARAICRAIALTANAGVGVRLKPGEITLCVSDLALRAPLSHRVRRGGGYVDVGQPVYASARYAWAWREETTMFSSPS